MWNRFILFLVSCLLVGCGNSDFITNSESSSTPSLGEEQLSLVTSGSGAVQNQADADFRVLNEYLSVLPAVNAQLTLPLIGSSNDPFLEILRVPNDGSPGEAHRSGTEFSEPFLLYLQLPWDAYAYYVDGMPFVDKGHPATLVLVRASDGAIFERAIDSDPAVNGASPLSQPRFSELLVYRQQDFPGANPIQNRLTGDDREFPFDENLPIVDDIPGVSQVTGLGVSGAANNSDGKARVGVQEDLDSARGIFDTMSGGAAGSEWYQMRDKDGNVGIDNFQTAIRALACDLGPEDKFFLFLSTHGHRTGFDIGHVTSSLGGTSTIRTNEFISWANFCQFLKDNVGAGDICVVLSTCNSGQALPAFEQWDFGNKNVSIIAVADGGLSVQTANGRCVLARIQEELDALEGDGQLTEAEIRSVFQNPNLTSDLTLDVITEKYCDLMLLIAGGDPEVAAQKKADIDATLGIPNSLVSGLAPDPDPPGVCDMADAYRAARTNPTNQSVALAYSTVFQFGGVEFSDLFPLFSARFAGFGEDSFTKQAAVLDSPTTGTIEFQASYRGVRSVPPLPDFFVDIEYCDQIRFERENDSVFRIVESLEAETRGDQLNLGAPDFAEQPNLTSIILNGTTLPVTKTNRLNLSFQATPGQTFQLAVTLGGGNTQLVPAVTARIGTTDFTGLPDLDNPGRWLINGTVPAFRGPDETLTVTGFLQTPPTPLQHVKTHALRYRLTP